MPFDPFEKRALGGTKIEISRLGLGTAPLGGWPDPIAHDEACQTIQRAWDRGIRYFDTAPFYGSGQSELFLGEVLAGKPRVAFCLSTKAGRRLMPGKEEVEFFKGARPFHSVFDFSAEGIEETIADSEARLGIARPDIIYLHDPHNHHDEVMRTAYPKLRDMRSEGEFGALGVGLNSVEQLVRFAREGEFDVFLLAGRYTLLEQSALDDLFPLAEERNIAIVAGAIYNSGLLIAPREGAMYEYSKVGPDILAKAQAIDSVCRSFDVPLRAAALQFAAAHPVVTSVLIGARGAGEVDDTLEIAQRPIPPELWSELKLAGLLREDAPTPN